jgi:hypothetical protein
MKSLMRKLLGQGQTESTPAKPASGRDSPLTIEDGSENATRRQLVQVLLRDALRKHGIPPGWIECQMLVVASRSRGPGVYMRLVLKHWDERFVKYMPAFQSTLLADIERFEPKAAEWLHGVSWQLEVGESCPHTSMPDKAYWTQPKRKVAPIVVVDSQAPDSGSGAPSTGAVAFQVTQPFQESNAQRDLEALFAIRDKELGRVAADGHAPVGYEKTQPSPL